MSEKFIRSDKVDVLVRKSDGWVCEIGLSGFSLGSRISRGFVLLNGIRKVEFERKLDRRGLMSDFENIDSFELMIEGCLVYKKDNGTFVRRIEL